jgi:hypothetical protein
LICVGEEDRGVADGVRLVLDDLARQRSAVCRQRVSSPIRSRGMPDALSAALSRARSRAAPTAWALAEVA